MKYEIVIQRIWFMKLPFYFVLIIITLVSLHLNYIEYCSINILRWTDIYFLKILTDIVTGLISIIKGTLNINYSRCSPNNCYNTLLMSTKICQGVTKQEIFMRIENAWILSVWLQIDKKFILFNILNPGQRRAGTSSHTKIPGNQLVEL